MICGWFKSVIFRLNTSRKHTIYYVRFIHLVDHPDYHLKWSVEMVSRNSYQKQLTKED